LEYIRIGRYDAILGSDPHFAVPIKDEQYLGASEGAFQEASRRQGRKSEDVGALERLKLVKQELLEMHSEGWPKK